jgi:chromosome segregation ATPase
VFILIAAVIFSVVFFFGLKFLIQSLKKKTTSEATSEVPLIVKKIAVVDEAIEKAIQYASDLAPFDDAIERQEKEKVMRQELDKELSALGVLESKLNELKLEVEDTEKEYNEIKKGKESSQELDEAIKANKPALATEHKELQNNIESTLRNISEFITKTRLNANQEAGLKLITNNIQNANKQLGTLVQSYNQSSTRFLNLYEQFNDLEIEFSKLVEKELND